MSILLGCALAGESARSQEAAPDPVGRWSRFEAVFENPSWDGNPFDVEFRGVFTSPSGRVLEHWGFHAGERIWKLFFMPDEIGTWTFATRSTDGDLDGREGTFTCVASALPGPLRGDGPHWVLGETRGAFPVLWNPPVSDGVPWGFRGRDPSHPTVREALDFAADTVGARVLGIHELLVVPTGWAESWPQAAVPYEVGEEGSRFHLPFWDRLNATLDAARDLGMGHYLMLYGDDELRPDRFGVTPRSQSEIRFLRYVVARLACYPIVLWDSGIDIGEYRSDDWIDWYVAWFTTNDPWRHPVGSRSGGGSGGKIPDAGTYLSIGGAALPGRDALLALHATAVERSIPVAHTDHWRPYIARGDWTHEKIRIAHWRCALSGGQAVFPDYNQGTFVWDEVTGIGGPWIGHASRFFASHLRGDLRALRPDDGLLLGGDPAIAATHPGHESVVYLETGGSVELDLPPEARDTLAARWYNPRSGRFTTGTLEPRADGTGAVATSPTRGPDSDWVLHLHRPPSPDPP